MTTLADVFHKLKYFKEDENWGDPTKVSPSLGIGLDMYRGALGRAVHISPIRGAVYAKGGHKEASWHYIIPERNILACAADIYPEGDLFRAWLLAVKFPFRGVGLYPYWKWPSKGLIGGLHVDYRPLGETRPEAFWWVDKTGNYRTMVREADCAALMGVLVNFKMRARAGTKNKDLINTF